MAEAKEAPESLQTEVDTTALEAADAEAFAKFADKFYGQEAPTAPEGTGGDKTTDLSHPKEEPEAPAEPAAPEPPAEPESPESEDDDKLPPELKDRISKRIGKEVAKRKAEQERAEALEAELADLKAKLDKPADPEPEKPAEPPSIPIPALQKLEAEIGKVDALHKAATEYLTRLRRDPERVLTELQKKVPDADLHDEEQARDFLEGVRENTGREWHKLVTRHESERVRWESRMETEREQTFATVKQLYPWVEAVRNGKDTRSAEAKIAARILKEAPGLDKAPKGWQVIARLVRAEMAEQAEPDKTATPPPRPPRLPTTLKPATPSSGTAKPKVESSELAKRAIDSGEIEDVEEYIKANLA